MTRKGFLQIVFDTIEKVNNKTSFHKIKNSALWRIFFKDKTIFELFTSFFFHPNSSVFFSISILKYDKVCFDRD